MRKLTLIFLLSCALITLALPVLASPKSIRYEIILNEQYVTSTMPLIEEKGNILIPLREFASAMGASSITWDDSHHTVTVVVDDFFKAHEYLSFLSGLQSAQNDYPLPPRL